MLEEKYMRRAIDLARRGSGAVNPNPLVGAVIVRDGRVLGEGWHERYGQLHAERNAIAHAKEAGEDLKGSTIYVTLEPCCHYGKTPPCTEAILEEGIGRVVVGSDDPNPLVAGKGFEMLQEKGVEVVPHFLKEECDGLNDVFFHFIRTQRPFIAMKYAMTLDGKIACHTGDSMWVTGEIARNHVHQLRNHYTGIMAGIGTVLADDPMLNCRIQDGRDPVRIIADSRLRIPMDSRLVESARDQRLIIACLDEADPEKKEALTRAGAEVIPVPKAGTGSIDLVALMEELGKRKIDGILLEGGGTLNESFLQAGLVNKVYCYLAPKMFGGADARTPVEGAGVDLAAQAWRFRRTGIRELGEDLLLEFELHE